MKFASKMFRLTLAMTSAGALVAAAGCKVGPDHKDPAQGTPESFTHTDDGGFRAESRVSTDKPIEVRWWTLLGDPALDGLIERAVAGNLDVKLAAARIREARAQRGVVGAEGLPTVDVDAAASRARVSRNVAQGIQTDPDGSSLYTAGFDADWELDFFGRVARSVEAAEADIESAREDQRAVLVSLAAEVARNYIELRGFQARLDIANKNIEVQRSTLELTRSRFKAGLTNDLDVAQAETALSATESTVPGLDRSIKAAIHRIGVLTGLPPTSLLADLSPAAPIPTTPGELPIGLPSELLRRRPDVQRAERDIAAATARIGVATADLYPRFSLTGSFGVSSDNIANIGDASSRFWSFGPAVRWPVLDWNRIRSSINVQEARNEQALVRYEQTVLGSFEEVENALVAYTREQARRRSLTDAVSSSQRAFDLANQLYKSGISDFQRVLDSQRSLYLAEDSLTDSKQTVSSNLVALYKALGGGWEVYSPEQEREPNKLPPPTSLLTSSKDNAAHDND